MFKLYKRRKKKSTDLWIDYRRYLYCACALGKNPACMLFANPIDSLAAAGAVLADVWVDGMTMPVVDSLGEEFLQYVKDGMKITVKENGVVEVE